MLRWEKPDWVRGKSWVGYSGEIGVAWIYERDEDIRQATGTGYTWHVAGVDFRAPGAPQAQTRGVTATLPEAKAAADALWRAWVLAAGLHGPSAMTVDEIVQREG